MSIRSTARPSPISWSSSTRRPKPCSKRPRKPSPNETHARASPSGNVGTTAMDKRSMAAALAIIGGLALPAHAAQAQSVEEFYRGKTINLLIGYSVGGGYDLYGRLIARHLGKHIPGRPSI